MAKAEGKTFDFLPETEIKHAFLETFEFSLVGPEPGAGRKFQMVEYHAKEFSAVCPFSGLPDTGKVLVQYIPRARCLELKALKYYLTSFRNVGIYQEAVTDRVSKDLWKVLDPVWLSVTTVYATRGGIDTVCRCTQTHASFTKEVPDLLHSYFLEGDLAGRSRVTSPPPLRVVDMDDLQKAIADMEFKNPEPAAGMSASLAAMILTLILLGSVIGGALAYSLSYFWY